MNVYEAIRKHGDDEHFEPNAKAKAFAPTDAAPGSERKRNVLRRRVELGLPLWHPFDAEYADAETKIQHGKTGVANPIKQVVNASFQRRKAPAE